MLITNVLVAKVTFSACNAKVSPKGDSQQQLQLIMKLLLECFASLLRK